MAQVIKKENISVVIGEYTNQQGQQKKQYRTIGELVTMQGDDGSYYQFGQIWGPHGATRFNVYAQEDRQQAVNTAQQAANSAPPGYNPQTQGVQQRQMVQPQSQQGGNFTNDDVSF